MRRPCLEPGCSSDAEQGLPRCAEHQREHTRAKDQRTERAGQRVYRTKRWQILRRRKLFHDPLCERCGAIATEVHHIKGVEVSTWEMEQLESLCASCHAKETRAEQLRGSGAALVVLPVLPGYLLATNHSAAALGLLLGAMIFSCWQLLGKQWG